MTKTLYVTDLDGTLLNKHAEVPAPAAEMLRELVGRGVCISYATARTIQSVRHILSGVPTEHPIALMNGVLVCDMAGGERYLFAAYLSEDNFDSVRRCLNACEVDPFMYFLSEGRLSTAYTRISNRYMESFMEERVRKYNKPFTRLADGDTYSGRPIYFAAMDTEEKIRSANELCLSLPGIRTACYRDSYQPDFWYLEVFDRSASKKNAVLEMKRLMGADRIVAFGDNYNDLPMLEAADESYAVASAPEEVRLAADGVIPSPEECGVPLRIAALEGIVL